LVIENGEYMEIPAMTAIIIGLVIFAIGYLKMAKKFNKLAVFGGIIIVLLAAFMPGYGLWADMIDITGTPTTAVATGAPAGWTIVPTDVAASGSLYGTTWNSGKTAATIPVTVNEGGTTHFVFSVNRTRASFVINPVAAAGASNDDIYVIHFRCDYLTQVSGADLFSLSGTTYWHNCTVSTTSYGYEGSYAFQPTTAAVTLNVNGVLSGTTTTDGAAYKLSTVGLNAGYNVYIWDDYGFSATYPVTAVTVVST